MKPMNKEQVNQLTEHYVAANPNLKVGDIVEKDDTYVSDIATKNGSLVEKIIVDKKTGFMKRSF